MDISNNIKHFAKDAGYPEVRHLHSWNGMEVYVASDPVSPYEGLPQYILEDGDDIRWASFAETEMIMSMPISS